jgi:hypothetical protein
MVWRFIKELFRGFIHSYNGIGFWLGAVSVICWRLLPLFDLGSKVDAIIAAISLPWRLLILLGFIFISVILTSYSMYKKYHQAAKTDIKQEIRTFLESINPLILQKIDAGEKEIIVSIIPDTHIKLVSLSQQKTDFDKFLSFEWSGYVSGKCDSIIEDLSPTGHIRPETTEYYLHPKDVLKK